MHRFSLPRLCDIRFRGSHSKCNDEHFTFFTFGFFHDPLMPVLSNAGSPSCGSPCIDYFGQLEQSDVSLRPFSNLNNHWIGIVFRLISELGRPSERCARTLIKQPVAMPTSIPQTSCVMYVLETMLATNMMIRRRFQLPFHAERTSSLVGGER